MWLGFTMGVPKNVELVWRSNHMNSDIHVSPLVADFIRKINTFQN